MNKLITLGQYSFNPNRVISAHYPGNLKPEEITAETPVMIQVDMNEWTATYNIHGYDLAQVTAIINEARDS